MLSRTGSAGEFNVWCTFVIRLVLVVLAACLSLAGLLSLGGRKWAVKVASSKRKSHYDYSFS